jgi:SAM-dependent methyltransferase
LHLKSLQRNWDRFGATDPFWAIATAPEYRGNRWDIDQFFATGQRQVSELVARIEQLGMALSPGSALDFGCGVGRLTQGLALYFTSVRGVDIAPSMIELANRYNRHPGVCHYDLNSEAHLVLYPANTFDLVLSEITLLHMDPSYSLGYVAEFLRVVRRDGLIVFQLPIPTRRQKIRACLPASLVQFGNAVRTLRRPLMEVYGVARSQVEEFVRSRGGVVIAVDTVVHPKGDSDPDYRYFVSASGSAP